MQVDDLHVGVRGSNPDVVDALRRLFGSAVVDAAAPHNWSVRIGGYAGDEQVDRSGDDDDDPVREEASLHLLYRGRSQVTRSRRPSRVLASVASHVSAEADRPLLGHVPRGLALVGADGRAVITSAALKSRVRYLQPLLERQGVRVVDAPDVAVDVDTAAVVVPEPLFSLDAADAAQLDQRFGARPRDHHAVAPGRYPLAGWVVVPTAAVPDTPAGTVATVVETVVPPADIAAAQRLLDAVATLTGSLPVLPVSSAGRTDAVEVVTSLIG